MKHIIKTGKPPYTPSELELTWHNSQRGWFAGALYEKMKTNDSIVLVTCDLGYKMFDKIRDQFPDRFFNVGASEQAGMGVAVGLALNNKIPFIYSITPFLIYRPLETIRNYINHEQIPVRLVAGGRDRDYGHDGFSHYAEEAKQIMDCFPNITQYWPTEKEEIPTTIDLMIRRDVPCFLSLRR